LTRGAATAAHRISPGIGTGIKSFCSVTLADQFYRVAKLGHGIFGGVCFLRLDGDVLLILENRKILTFLVRRSRGA
jgi:hypothetical protein